LLLSLTHQFETTKIGSQLKANVSESSRFRRPLVRVCREKPPRSVGHFGAVIHRYGRAGLAFFKGSIRQYVTPFVTLFDISWP